MEAFSFSSKFFIPHDYRFRRTSTSIPRLSLSVPRIHLLFYDTIMKHTTLFLSMVAACIAAAGDKGSYSVDGLGSRKQEILNAGGGTLDLAIAMLESDNMGTDYAYGQFAPSDSSHTLLADINCLYRRQQKRRRRELWHFQAELGSTSRVLEAVSRRSC